MRVAVVVSTWTGHPSDYLFALTASMARYSPGAAYDLFLSANGMDYSPPAKLARLFREIFVRENSGYNLGAWDHAWRRLPGYDRFLFLQDDCRVLQNKWLRDFIRCFDSTPLCGLVGENLPHWWDRPWTELSAPLSLTVKETDPDRRATLARFFRDRLADWGIPEGPTARHLTTVVQFTSRSILEEVDGYNLGRTYDEAIAAEVAFSRKIESRGYTLVQIGRRRHTRIAHAQWPRYGFFVRLRRSLLKRFPLKRHQ
jgi:hypothetical protein